MILLNRIKIFGKPSDPINSLNTKDTKEKPLSLKPSWIKSTQIRKHISAVVIIPRAGALEGVEFGGGKGPGGNGQGNGLVQSLLAGKAHTSRRSLIRMFVAILTPAFYAGP